MKGIWSLILAVAVIAAVACIQHFAASLGPRLRSVMISKPLLQAARHMLPPLSQTEQEALDAGSVWWDGELLSGNPDWTKLDALPPEGLTDEERAELGWLRAQGRT